MYCLAPQPTLSLHEITPDRPRACHKLSLLQLFLWWDWQGYVGSGWNFGFVGASALVTQCHRPDERNKVQAFNDFLIFGTMAIGSFSSGQMLSHFGWNSVNLVVFPPVVLALAALVWLALKLRKGPQAA